MSFRQRTDRSQHVFSNAKIRQYPLNTSRFSRDQDVRPSSRSAVNKPLQSRSRFTSPSPPVVSPPHQRSITPRAVATRRALSSPSPPPAAQGRQAFHMYEDPPEVSLSVDTFDDEDEDWRCHEHTSSGEHSSDQSKYLLPSSPPKIPRPPKRLPLFPVATKSRKRASIKEAHRRRFGALFPLDQDSVEEKNALKPDGKLGNYLHLVTCLPDRKIPPKPKRRKTKVVDDACPSCSASPTKGQTEKQRKELNIPILILTPPQYPPPLPSTPIPEYSCPLVQHIVDIDLAESQAVAKAQASRLVAEEAAFQASLLKAREFAEHCSTRTRRRTNAAGTPASGAKWLRMGHMTLSAYQDNMCMLPPVTLAPNILPAEDSAEPTPSPPRVVSHPIVTAYGYRARGPQVKAAFGSDWSNTKLEPISPSCVEFATFHIPRRRSSAQSFSKDHYRSPSPLPRSWLDDPNIPVDDDIISETEEISTRRRHRSPMWMIPSPPPVSPSQTLRRRSIADQRFFRVFALENAIRIRAAELGLGQVEWMGSRAMNMCRPVRAYCLAQRRKSPLAC
ncbi:hypothetical protein BS47DRAFT_1485358 [Hydnum rufescens UP504]|uniref:Uncharacterized protein n=1 Tax=Hydnum rufescens UP504 TaxID=1448309 RepID=A0A9P6AXM1_9AGAM|nr:hypothetical protein BS47DRAFT_1485358 [Hydnum rufescens UP504]